MFLVKIANHKGTVQTIENLSWRILIKRNHIKLTIRSLRRWTAPSSMGAETNNLHLFYRHRNVNMTCKRTAAYIRKKVQWVAF